VLYYATSLFDYYSYGVYYSRPERYYFWGYYVLMNWFWIMIPGCKFVFFVFQKKEAVREVGS